MLAILLLASVAAAQQLLDFFPDCASAPLSSNPICDSSLSAKERAEGLVKTLNLEEKFNLTHFYAGGAPRIGLPAYNWWSEALHGVAASPGVQFALSGDFSYATSFPQPITMAAAFDDKLIHAIAEVISTESRAFNNAHRAGLDYWTPNINPFRDPRWGRGQETPGEDTYVIKKYIENYVMGLQGGPNPDKYKIISTCKHYVAYDLENWHGNTRYGFDAKINAQELAKYYMQPFQQCARDSKVGSIMCSYNAINGVPACANDYTIATVLRGHWNWTKDENYITSDCTAVQNMFTDHHAFPSREATVAAAFNAGIDTECGSYTQTYLPGALSQNLLKESTLDRSLVRLHTALVKLGYFDSPDDQPFRKLGWSNVSTPSSEALAEKIANEGIVLLKNDGTLPLKVPESNYTVLMMGGWVDATTQMQGIYTGPARTIVSPRQGIGNISDHINIVTRNWWDSPLLAVLDVKPDLIVWIDSTSEGANEAKDRNTVSWDLMQEDGVEMMATTGIPLVVVHMGEQVDDTTFFKNPNISSVLWAGYPSMAGGTSIANIIFGKVAPAARMPVTQYPRSYVDQSPMTDMNLRPQQDLGRPGRTYKWFDNATVEFGFGLHYTNFSTKIMSPETSSFTIQSLVSGCDSSKYTHMGLCPFLPTKSASTLSVNVANTGKIKSDFVTLAFVAGEYGPTPRPRKSLVSYQRLFGIEAGQEQTASLIVNLSGLARHDEKGNEVLYPGKYKMLIDVPTQSIWEFELTGDEYVLDKWPAAP